MLNTLFKSGEVERLSKIGDFQVVEFLGKGSQGPVYKVLNLHASNHTILTNLTNSTKTSTNSTNSTNSIYALKLVSPDDLPTKVYEVLQKTKSPHLISIKEVLDLKVESFPLKAVVMEYLSGIDLQTYLASAEFRNSTQEVKNQNAFDYVKCIKVAMDEKATIKIFHGDLVVANIFLVDNDFSKCKIIDFDRSCIGNSSLDLEYAVIPVYQIIGMSSGRISADILDKLYVATTPQEMLEILKANGGYLRGTTRPAVQPPALPSGIYLP